MFFTFKIIYNSECLELTSCDSDYDSESKSSLKDSSESLQDDLDSCTDGISQIGQFF